MSSPVSLRRVASTVAPSEASEYTPTVETKGTLAGGNNLIHEIIFDLKPFADSVKADERMWFLVQQVKQIGESAFWGNNCLIDCSKRHGWRLNIISEPKSVGDEVFGFVVYKIDIEQGVLHIQYIAVAERHRRRGIGSKLIKSLQQYAAKTLTKSMVERIACACVPEAVEFYQKHCFKKGKRIISEEESEPCAFGTIETLIPLQYAMEWRVPDKRKKRNH